MAAHLVSTPMFSKQIPIFGFYGILWTSKVIVTFLMIQRHHPANPSSNRLQHSSKPGLDKGQNDCSWDCRTNVCSAQATITLKSCIGFAWQSFGSEEATGVASVRSCWKLPLCLMEPTPASSKTGPPLAKAEPISNGGSTSGIMYLRRGKICCVTATAAGERSENMWEQQLCRPPGRGRRRQEELQALSRNSLAAGGEARGEAGYAPQPMEVHGGAKFYLQPGGGSHARGTHAGEAHGGLSPVGGPHTGAGD